MKVSLRSTYGIMAAVDLAMQGGSAPIQAKAIARRQGIPARFLEQVLHAMKKALLLALAALVITPSAHAADWQSYVLAPPSRVVERKKRPVAFTASHSARLSASGSANVPSPT